MLSNAQAMAAATSTSTSTSTFSVGDTPCASKASCRSGVVSSPPSCRTVAKIALGPAKWPVSPIVWNGGVGSISKSTRLHGLRAQLQTADSEAVPQEWRVCCSSQTTANSATSRRCLLSSVLVSSTALSFLQRERSALASSPYREYVDRLDGYIVSYPSGWIQVRGAGADIFFRDPVNLDENLVVDFSSPSSSRFKSVKDLGTPQQAAQKVLKQKITEFMSTRLGVRRESKIVSANSRVGDDGRLYYDIEVDVKSFANTNQLAVMPEDRVAKLEWSRRYLSTLGVENNRLYELRLQAPEKVLAEEGMGLRQIMNSFQLVKLDT